MTIENCNKQPDLVKAMQDRGWTQTRTAKFLGIHTQYFGRIINYRDSSRTFSEELSDRLFELTGKLPDELFPQEQISEELNIDEPEVIQEIECSQVRVLGNGALKLLAQISPPELAFDFELKAMLEEAIATLPSSRMQEVVRLRYFEDQTLAAVADQLKVSSERIRQIEAKALQKLRHPSRSKILKGFVKL